MSNSTSRVLNAAIPTTSKVDIMRELGNINDPYFTPEAMIAAVACKKQRRKKKALDFNCFVLDRKFNHDELAIFLKFLESNKSQIPDKTRFQIVYRMPDLAEESKVIEYYYHWSAIDVQINKGKIEFYLLDAAGAYGFIMSGIVTIHRICPDAKIRMSFLSIQHDSENCATFAIDHAFRLAKISNLHEQLNELEQQNTFLITLMNSNMFLNDRNLHKENSELVMHAMRHSKYISIDNFPAHFGPLFRNMQRKDFDDDFIDRMNGNDKKSLNEYINARLALEQTKDGMKNRRHAIHFKRRSIKNSTENFLAHLNEESYANIFKENNYKNKLAPQHDLSTTDVKNTLTIADLPNNPKVHDLFLKSMKVRRGEEDAYPFIRDCFSNYSKAFTGSEMLAKAFRVFQPNNRHGELIARLLLKPEYAEFESKETLILFLSEFKSKIDLSTLNPNGDVCAIFAMIKVLTDIVMDEIPDFVNAKRI